MAFVAKGVNLKVKYAGNAVYVKAGELKDFGGVYGGTASVIDVSHFDSTAKEKLLGLTDEGQITLTFNYVPSDPGQLELIAARASSNATQFRLALGTATGAKQFDFTGFVLANEISGSVDEAQTMATSIEISGPVVANTVA